MFEGLGNAVHLIAAVVWIGGLAFLVLGLRPALKKSVPDAAARDAVDQTVYRRFWLLAAVSAAVVFVSGTLLMGSDPHYEGVFHFDNTWSKVMLAKHSLFIALGALVIAQRKGREAQVERDLADIALMLGAAILVLTGILTSIP